MTTGGRERESWMVAFLRTSEREREAGCVGASFDLAAIADVDAFTHTSARRSSRATGKKDVPAGTVPIHIICVVNSTRASAFTSALLQYIFSSRAPRELGILLPLKFVRARKVESREVRLLRENCRI